MEIKDENVVIVQFRDTDSGEFVNDVYAKIEVSLAAYDKGINDAAILELTKRINGGTHGLEDRKLKTYKYYEYVK
jgi:predicted chitinase